nr:hypothetical protein [Tanacetum cinerariifolium]
MPEDPYVYVVAVFQALPPPDYVPGLEAPEQAPPSPPVYPEYIPPEDDVFPAEEQSLPAAASPTADSPGYIPESDLDEDSKDDDEDSKEDPADYPADHDDEGEEEEPFGDDADEENKVTELDAVQEQDTQDIYGVMEDTHGRQTEIFQRVEALVDDSQYHYETGRLVDQEARCSREAWAYSIGFSSAVHFELQGVERYIDGFPDTIHGSVVASKPKSMQEAIEMATGLMDKKIRTYRERQAANKRKFEDTYRNNQSNQQPPKRQDVARAYAAGS